MPYRQYYIGSCIIFGTLQFSRLHYNLFDVVCTYIYIYICLCLLCTVVCMHNIHTAHIFIV